MRARISEIECIPWSWFLLRRLTVNDPTVIWKRTKIHLVRGACVKCLSPGKLPKSWESVEDTRAEEQNQRACLVRTSCPFLVAVWLRSRSTLVPANLNGNYESHIKTSRYVKHRAFCYRAIHSVRNGTLETSHPIGRAHSKSSFSST